MLNKIGRGKNTGQHISSKITIPWQVMTSLMGLLISYGASSNVQGKRHSKTYTITIKSEDSARTIWHPMRIGKNYLAKRKFKKITLDGKLYSQFNGSASVVVTEMTPVTVVYKAKY